MSTHGKKSSYIIRRDSHFYLDQETKIWYTDNGLAVTTLYLSSLAPMVQRRDLTNHFSIFGPVENVRIHKKLTHSIGFVKFQEAASVAKVLIFQCHTIGGCRTKVGIADSKHQLTLINTNTNTSRTNIMQLKDEFLSKIFSMKYLLPVDLCAIAETCVRFRDVVHETFIRKRSDLRTLYTINNAERMLLNFGPFISEVWIGHIGPSIESSYHDKLASKFNSLTKHCNDLESLHFTCCFMPEDLTIRLKPLFTNLRKLHIENCTIQSAGEELFANCRSLVELRIGEEDGDIAFIFKNTFPSLERLECDDFRRRSIESHLKEFLPRHRNLKELSIWSLDDGIMLLPTIASNCRKLEKLQIRILTVDNSTPEALVCFDHLKKLKVSCDRQNATKLMQALKTVKPLEFLELDNVHGKLPGDLGQITEFGHY